MSRRDLLFLTLVAGGLVVLGANLLPQRRRAAAPLPPDSVYADAAFRATLTHLNATLRAGWAAEGLEPAPPAPDLLVARRLSLALVGSVPSLEEVRRFEALPPGEQLPWWLDKLLAERRYADYWGERLARMTVGTEDGPFVLFRRRRYVAWLSDALHENRPYDALVRDVIASKGLWTDRPATNFVSVTSRPATKNQPDPVRLAGRVTRAFLGLRIDCAQCHDHPFAAWKQTDFEGFSAYFGQTQVGFRGVNDGPPDNADEYRVEDTDTHEMVAVAPAVPYAPEALPASGTRRERLAGWVTSPRNPYFSRAIVNRVWALVTGRPLVAPVDNVETDGPPPAVLQLLADDFTAQGHDLRRLIRLVAASEAFARDSRAPHDLTEAHDRAHAAFPVTRLRPEQVSGSVLQSASLTTNDAQAHLLLRLMRYGQQNDFLTRYSDRVEDEFDNAGGTIPQRLLLMNGEVVRERIKPTAINATLRVSQLAPTDAAAVEAAFLVTLTRRPTPAEAAHFAALVGDRAVSRPQHFEDVWWSLINATEFSWNH